MADEQQIKNYAKNIILRACENGKYHNYDSAYYSVRRVETPAGEIGFQIEKSNITGSISILYSPQPFIVHLIEIMESQIKECHPEGKFADIPPEALIYKWDEKLCDIATLLLIFAIEDFRDSDSLIVFWALKTVKYLTSDNILERSEIKKSEKVNQIILEINKRKKARILELEKQHIASLSAPQFVFCDVYDKELKTWQNIKDFYKEAEKRGGNAIEAVKAAFKHLDLDDDLIEQLADLDDYTAQPATIARESTARLLNVPDSISGRKLERYLTDSRKQRKLVSDEEAANALDRYERATLEKEFLERRIAEAINQSIGEISQLENEDLPPDSFLDLAVKE